MLKGSEASARCGQASQRTLQRWRQWWRGRFIESRFWQQARAWLSPPVCESRLPGSVLERFNGETLGRRLSRLLHWLSPITGATATEGVTTDSLREADVTQKMSLGSAGRRF
jgi:hypothetical protein